MQVENKDENLDGSDSNIEKLIKSAKLTLFEIVF